MNNITTYERYLSLENMCNRILNEKGIRFAGVINKMGKLETGGFRREIKPHEDNEKQKMMFMQFVLMYNMRNECNDTSGKLDYIMTKRRKSTMLGIPINDDKLLLISAEPYLDVEKFAEKLKKVHIFGKENEIMTNPISVKQKMGSANTRKIIKW